jgi:hypothetical protein
MTNIRSLIAVAAIALTVCQTTHAQFSMPSLGGAAKSMTGSSNSGTDLTGQQDSLVRGYVAAHKDVLLANSKMEEALGMKQAAAASKATSEALTEGATKDTLEASNKAIAASTEAVAAELAKRPVLDANSKALYGEGLLALVSSASKYIGVGKSVSTMASSLSGASPMMLPKLQSAVYVVSSFPASAAKVSDTLKTAVSFAQSQDIPVPSNVNETMAAL